MPRTLQFKRYGTPALANTAGANGELIIDSTTQTLTLHNGTTLGGSRIASESYVQSTTGVVLAQAAFNKANTASANTVIIQGVNVTQNIALTQIQTVNSWQNNEIIAITQTTISTANLKLLVANTTTYDDFKTAISNL